MIVLGLVGLPACALESGVEAGEASSLRSLDEAGQVDGAEQAIIPGATIEEVSSTKWVLPAQMVIPVVACPSGTVVVGGGYSTIPNAIRVISSRAVDSTNAWRVVFQNQSATERGLGLAYARCLRGTSATVRTPGKFVVLPPGGFGCDQLACSAGEFLIGGGFHTGSIAFSPAASYNYAESEWRVCGKNLNNFEPVQFEVRALCMSGVTGGSVTGGSVITNGQPYTVVGPGETVDVDTLPCPSGTLLNMGGLINDSPLIIERSSRADTTWRLRVHNPTSQARMVLGKRYCLDLWE